MTVTQLSELLGERLQQHALKISTAESCTGGLIAGAITEIPGSSGWFEQGWVTYSNEAKVQALGVAVELLESHGAVSEATVLAMAEGALRVSGADIAVAVSGVAGPEGGSPDKPVGTVWLGWATRPDAASGVTSSAERYCYDGDRQAVRLAAVADALRGTIKRVEQSL